MKKIAVVLGVLALGVLVSAAVRKPDKASIYCSEAGRGETTRRVLVIGESWASKGRLLPEMPKAIVARTQGRVRVCSIGYSGKNSAKVLAMRSAPLERYALGGKPDSVIILLGVNDQIQHRGAAFYASNVDTLRRKYAGARVTVVSPPRVSEHPDLPVHQALKNRLQGVFNTDAHRDYVAALAGQFAAEEIVNFEDFSAGYPEDAKRFAPDGIHLTNPGFHEYGRFLGENLPI